jgi:hypothetical protein
MPISYSGSGGTYSSSGGNYYLGGPEASLNCNEIADSDLESLAAVGAGEQVEQNITYVEGLVKPIFSEIVKVKYMWWDESIEQFKNMFDELLIERDKEYDFDHDDYYDSNVEFFLRKSI